MCQVLDTVLDIIYTLNFGKGLDKHVTLFQIFVHFMFFRRYLQGK